MSLFYGGIEAGGTKFVCAVGTGPDDLELTRFPTTTPAETFGQAIEFFKAQASRRPLAAIGIASFGPVDPNPASPTFGYITSTPKPGWDHANFMGTIKQALGVPVGFDTDVNVAALGEHRWGAAQGLENFIYLTIGTGVGGGGLMNGKLMHGLIHPEMGHIRLPHDWSADPFPGICPYHGDCLEGLACGPAIERRWNARGETLGPDHSAWELEAHYIALALSNFICTLSPERIILGGGVMDQGTVLPMVQSKTHKLLNGYVRAPEIFEHIDQYIVAPALAPRSGVLGAIALAEQEARAETLR
ncbi:MAG: ROK family protein [Anaerolineae bacterium]